MPYTEAPAPPRSKEGSYVTARPGGETTDFQEEYANLQGEGGQIHRVASNPKTKSKQKLNDTNFSESTWSGNTNHYYNTETPVSEQSMNKKLYENLKPSDVSYYNTTGAGVNSSDHLVEEVVYEDQDQ